MSENVQATGMLHTVKVTRYVTPLREGGSLPAIVEADDDGTYVLKFRGAGQGPKALIAGLVAPRSAIMQLSPVHSVLTADAEVTLEHLLATLVRSDRGFASSELLF